MLSEQFAKYAFGVRSIHTAKKVISSIIFANYLNNNSTKNGILFWLLLIVEEATKYHTHIEVGTLYS